MDNIKMAMDYLIKNGYKMVEDNNNYAVQSTKLAIEALKKQIELSEWTKELGRENKYDIRTVSEIIDILKEIQID